MINEEEELFGGPTLKEETDEPRTKGKLLRPNKILENGGSQVQCGCGRIFFREKHHEWRATLAKHYKLKSDQVYIYCECDEPIFENNLGEFKSDVVGVPKGKFTVENSAYLQIDPKIDKAVAESASFFFKNRKRITEILNMLHDTYQKMNSEIRDICEDLQIVARYYCHQNPNGKVLYLGELAFSPKDGIGRNGSRYSAFDPFYFLRSIWEKPNSEIDELKIHPRLKELLRAFKLLAYYDYRNVNRPSLSPVEDITGGNYGFSFEKITPDNFWNAKLNSNSLNERIEFASKLRDNIMREKLALLQLREVIRLHFANEILILCRLKYKK